MNLEYFLGTALLLISFPLAGAGLFFLINGISPDLRHLPFYMFGWTFIGLMALKLSVNQIQIWMMKRGR